MTAPTLGARRPVQPHPAPAQHNQGGQAPAASPTIPFTRAARKKTRLLGQYTITPGASAIAFAPIQVPAAGYLRRIRLTVVGTTSANAAAVAFAADAPFNVLQQISVLAANGDSLLYPIDGFALYVMQKYGCFSDQPPGSDPVLDPTFLTLPGAGTTGGSFSFNISIPAELDERDALCALPNMAANQSFLLQMSASPLASIYTVAPTTAPVITVTAVMEYWSAPAAANGSGAPQATAPPGNGSVSLLQVATPSIAPGSNQNLQLPNVGNVVRWLVFILRTAGGVRTDVDWPVLSNMYVNNDPWFYRTKTNWKAEMARRFGLRAAATAAPTAGALDNGVYVVSDFISGGSAGDEDAQATSNRNQWLVTNSATALNFEAVPWGAGAGQLQILTNSVRPTDPAALYQPFLI